MPYLLDTDSASLAFRGNECIRARIRQVPRPGVWLSAIAVEEIMQGALSSVNANRNKAGSAAAYELFLGSVESICEYRIHPFNKDAAALFASFLSQVKRVGSQDCRIAASAIAAGWIVVTANHRHFSQIPGVQFED